MLGKYVVNHVVTLFGKPNSKLGKIEGVIESVEVDEGGRGFLVMPSSGKKLIIYSDQISSCIIHSSLEEMKAKQGNGILEGTVDDIVADSPEFREVEEAREESQKRPTMVDMNDPQILDTLAGQISGGYGAQVDFSKWKKEKNDSGINEEDQATPEE